MKLLYNKIHNSIYKCTGTNVLEDMMKWLLLRKNFRFKRKKDLTMIFET